MSTEQFDNKDNQARGGVNDLYFVRVSQGVINETNIFDLKWWEEILKNNKDEKTNETPPKA